MTTRKVIQRAIPVPQAEVNIYGASGGQVFGNITRLAAGVQGVHHGADHLLQIDAPFAGAPPNRRDKVLDMRPFLIGQVAKIAPLVAVVAGAVFSSLHGASHETNQRYQENYKRFRNLKWQPRLTNSPDSRSVRPNIKY